MRCEPKYECTMTAQRHTLVILLLPLASLSLAQTERWTQARREIHENVCLSASNFLAYPEPKGSLTPAPKGYEPFYLSHYGRHGSRWLLSKGEYADAISVLRRAREREVLTARGELLLGELEDIYGGAEQRLGELTSVGERQHHGIGRRWPERFPEIFCHPRTQVDARSTVVIRCILSMTAACEELAAANPKARIHNDVSQSYQHYLNADWSRRAKDDNTARFGAIGRDYRTEYIRPERFWAELFTDTAYRDEKMPSRRKLMRQVFAVCSNQQSHDTGISLYDLFTEEECYGLWRCENIDWYVGYAQGTAPYTQAELLRNFISTADTIVGNGDYHGATLRYGHEVCLMPLVALMELGDCYPEVPAEGLDTLDRVWANYRIFPMASNVQLVFYRPKSGKGDVLVKALLNEEETTLPGEPVSGPYYKWSDLRAYYEEKLVAYGEVSGEAHK